ncbi:MAG: SAM-dependent methyltransferase [Planctomycetota bacterium]
MMEDPQWQTLRSEVEKVVDLVDSPLRLAGKDLNWLRVANPDQLLEAAVVGAGSKSEAELDPFWAATWRAAIGLDAFLARLDLTGTRVLELGCGSGQAGTAAAMRGALVTSTDSVELALKVAKLNSWFVHERIQFRQLIWGQEQLDEPKFPVLIGSDLVYDPNLFPLLEPCARQHLAEGGRMYLSEPHRQTGDRFSTWIRQAGWKTIEHDIDLNDERVPVRVFECWL